MGSRVGHGSTLVQGNIQNSGFVTGSSGWQLTAAGNLEADSGNFRGSITGSSGTFSGTVSAATITGGTITGTSINNGAGTFQVDTAGNLTATSATITGTVTTSNVTITGGTLNIGSGAFQVTSGCVVTATSITATGSITAGSGSSVPATYFADGTIPAGVVIGMADAASVSIRSGDYSVGSAGWAIWGDGDAEFNNIIARGTIKTASSGIRVEVGTTAVNRMDFYNSLDVQKGIILNIVDDLIVGAETGTGARIQFRDSGVGGHVYIYGSGSGSDFGVDVGGDIYLDHGTADKVFFQENGTTYLEINETGTSDAIVTATGLTLDTTTLNLDGSTAVNIKDNGTDVGVFTTTAVDIDATTITLDGTTINLDGTTDVFIKDNGTTYANFDYLTNAARLQLHTSSPSTAQGAQIILEEGSSGNLDTLQIDNYVVSGNDYMRIIGGGTVMGRIRLDSAMYGLAVTGRSLEINSSGTLGTVTSATRRKRAITVTNGQDLATRARSVHAKTYEWDPDEMGEVGEHLMGKTFLSLMAEDVHAAFPEATRNYVNEDGTVDGYDDHTIVAILWERLGAMEAEVEDLKSKTLI